MPALQPRATWPVRLLRICQFTSIGTVMGLIHRLCRPAFSVRVGQIRLLVR